MLRFTWKVFRKSRFRVSAFPRFRARDRGAALITVLLFVVLMFILITAMLTVTGNEIVIAGLQKDGMRATELAQAGIQEAIARVAMHIRKRTSSTRTIQATPAEGQPASPIRAIGSVRSTPAPWQLATHTPERRPTAVWRPTRVTTMWRSGIREPG